MRRLLAFVACSAVAAVALLVPSAASAAVAPALTGPASPANATITTLTFSWTNVTVAGEAITYRLFRAPGDCSTATAFAQVGQDHVDTLTTTDAPADGTYCYYVTADDNVLQSGPSNLVNLVRDTTLPVIAVTPSGGDGCTAPFTFTATAGDAAAMFVDGAPYTAGNTFPPGGAKYAQVTSTVTATDAAGNQAVAATVTGRFLDDTPPGPVSLEVSTDPAAQKATLNWDPVVSDGAPVTYRVRTRGPQGPKTDDNLTPPFQPLPLQVDATYEFTLEAVDACGRLTSSVRLVRLNDATPPSMPVVSGPLFSPVSHAITLSWVASSDNIQVDHYVVLRDGVPLGVTDATSFTDVAPPQHAQLSYVVRAVDTNGNSTDSAAAPITTPDWTPPNAPTLTVAVRGTTATLRWTAATDNVGVVGYDVVRDGKGQASMTSAVRTYRDVNLAPGLHTWTVRSRDDADLTANSLPQTVKVSKAVAAASVLSLRMAGGGTGALRYSLKPRSRLLVDLHVIGTLAKAKLRLYVNSGRGRITVWRGTPGSSAPRVRLGSALVRRGYVTVRFSRALHTGRIRLVLIPGGRVVIAGKGSHRPAMKMS